MSSIADVQGNGEFGQDVNRSQTQANNSVARRSAEISQVAKTSFSGLCASFARSKGVEVILSACVIGAGAFLLVSNPFGWAAATATKIFFISVIVLGSLSLINSVVCSPGQPKAQALPAPANDDKIAQYAAQFCISPKVLETCLATNQAIHKKKEEESKARTARFSEGPSLLTLQSAKEGIEKNIEKIEDQISKLDHKTVHYNKDLQDLEAALVEQNAKLAAVQLAIKKKGSS